MFAKYQILLLISIVSTSSSCILENGLQGDCVNIRKCPYQIGRLRVGAPVTKCDHPTLNVCCPTQKSIAEQKCEKWHQMLFAPTSFDQSRLNSELCAVDTKASLIVGGRDAKPYEYPHAVALGYGTDPKSLKFACGATLISEDYLLTAAHCVTHKRLGKPTYAVIADRILDPAMVNYAPNPYRKVVSIAQHIVHPDYKPPLIYHDIALIRLSSPLDLDRYVLPACISTPIKAPRKNVLLEASGWGITDVTSSSTSNILQAVNITSIDDKTCNQIYGNEPDKNYRYPDGLVKSQICATGEDKDTCRGDSGGGLYTREKLCLFHVVGITSIGSKVCGLGNPAVYTNVASYQDWIESVVWGGRP
ncbi:unnamed protein product [Orchesella dallaii]|uniref:Peptidase S1 domain-containing protein n=1 Tax=Orchesella dallaii TaxID=48710 RepID=A0ABP1R3I6_9HEXA